MSDVSLPPAEARGLSPPSSVRLFSVALIPNDVADVHPQAY